MKYIVIIGDGMADYKIEELNFKTPLEVAHKENIDLLAKYGKCGLLKTIPENFEPSSDVANLSILGYDPKKYYTGRAPIEAASKGIFLNDDEIAFRVNFITEKDGKIYDYSAGHISDEESKFLIDLLNESLYNYLKKIDGKFYHGVSYRNLLICKNKFKDLICVPPHNIIGKNIKENLIKEKDNENSEYEILNEMMIESKEILENCKINKEKKNKANMIWIWGQGTRMNLENFEEKYKLRGAVISAVDLIKGIGKCAGMDVIEVEGATGLWDTNYDGKAQACIDALKFYDFIYLHIEASDEASHIGDLNLKIKCIENFDYAVGKILKLLKERNINAKIAILPDHLTPVKLRTHVSDPVPFLIFENFKNKKERKFSEEECKNGEYGLIEVGKFIDVLIND